MSFSAVVKTIAANSIHSVVVVPTSGESCGEFNVAYMVILVPMHYIAMILVFICSGRDIYHLRKSCSCGTRSQIIKARCGFLEVFGGLAEVV